MPDIVEKFFFKPYKKDLFPGSCQCCIEPSEVFLINHVIFQKTFVNEDKPPLASLGFMAGEGIPEFNLERIVIRIGSYFFHPFGASGYIIVIFEDRRKKFFL